MNGRKRVALRARDVRLDRRWVLDEGLSGTVRDTWERGDGYKVEVWCTRVGVIQYATLTSPGGQKDYVSRSQNDKADKVIDWIVNPASAFRDEDR